MFIAVELGSSSMSPELIHQHMESIHSNIIVPIYEIILGKMVSLLIAIIIIMSDLGESLVSTILNE